MRKFVPACQEIEVAVPREACPEREFGSQTWHAATPAPHVCVETAPQTFIQTV